MYARSAADPADVPHGGQEPLAQGGARRVALVHHWMVSARGGERTLAALARLVPGAELYTLVHDARVSPVPPGVTRVHTSALQHLPRASRTFRAFLPLFPRAFSSFDLSGYDLVLSSDASLAKTVRVPEGAPHVCYCYSPPRWAWDLAEVYLQQSVPAPFRAAVRAVLARTREADRAAAQRVTHFIAISEHVRERIARCYGRQSRVVYPPADTEFFHPAPHENVAPPPDGRPYLVLGEAVPYKRFDLALLACRALDRPLVVAGSGRRLRALAPLAGPRTRFVADPDDAQVRDLYRGCRALLFPGEEDFGLVPVEAMACGRPVVTLGRGGGAESVQDGVTGCHYQGDTVADLVAALQRFESLERQLDPGACRARAECFSTARFLREMQAVLGVV